MTEQRDFREWKRKLTSYLMQVNSSSEMEFYRAERYRMEDEMLIEIDRLRADLNYRMEEEQLAKMQLEVALSELKTLRAELKDVEMHLETFRDERDALMEQNKTLRAELDMWKNHYAPRDEREFTGEESYEQSIRCKGG